VRPPLEELDHREPQDHGERQDEEPRHFGEQEKPKHRGIVYERLWLRNYDHGYGLLETGCRSPVAKRS
jgi:hypothetical protein